MTRLVFLQNAWSPVYAGGTWPRDSWLHALAYSRTGQRLQLLLGERYDLRQCWNTTEVVGKRSSSVVPPDEDHVARVLAYGKPDEVVACGVQAEKVLTRLHRGGLLVVPHPCARLLTNYLYEVGRRVLERGLRGNRIALRQRRGRVKVERLDP